MDVAATVLERFLRYVQIDTQSDERSETYPSSPKELNLLKLLAQELVDIGLNDVEMDRWGYVTATLPSTVPEGVTDAEEAPVIGFLAHVDTSPDITGAGVKPQVIRGYQGGPIVLPGDHSQVITAEETPHLSRCTSQDIVTSDGTTLLGADDKAGVAEIVTAMEYLARHPELPHGTIRVAFTPDEEIGRGVDHFDVAAFGARYAYTMDGGELGEIEDESFAADASTVTFHGRNVHPGYARGKLVNAIKLAATFLAMLPGDRLSPETTEGREGYLHPHEIEGNSDQAQVKLLVRDFEVGGLLAKEDLLRLLARTIEAREPRARVDVQIREQYRNMKQVLEQHPQVVARAEQAMRAAGVEPRPSIIRGGTDGSRLSFMGLPTANIFAGGHSFHSKREWVCVQDMARAVETIVNLAQAWAK